MTVAPHPTQPPAAPVRSRRLAAALVAGTLVAASAVAVVAAPAADAATRRQVMVSAASYARSQGYHVGIAVLDTRTGQYYGSGDHKGIFASESIVKVFIATRLAVTGQLYGSTKAAAYKMITQSDDGIASALYGRVGGDGLINWIKNRYHQPDLGYAPSRPGYWGNTHITPIGLVHLYAKLERDRRIAPFLLHAMHHATPYGSDGVYQYFGIPSATTGFGVKQGWGNDFDSSVATADFNTSGFVNNDRYTVAILARGPSYTYGSAISALLTATARRLLPGGVFPGTTPTLTSLSTRSGPTAGGNRVVVHGTDLTAVSAVLFGTHPGRNVRMLSSTAVAVTAPADVRERVDVRVVTDHGTTARTAAGRYLFEAAPSVTRVTPASGTTAGGTSVDVKGRVFSHVLRVYFGTVAATSYSVASRWHLTAVAPAGTPAMVHVRVITAYGRSQRTPANRYTYVAAPTITGITPRQVPAAGGTTVTITGTGFVPGTTVLFRGVPASSVKVVSPTTLDAVPAAATPGRAAVRVTTPYGTDVLTGAFRYV